MSANMRRILAIYIALAVLTSIFEIYVRLPQCAGVAACTISLGKGVVWSIVWPAGWVVYLKGMF
jgi:hypothetical protein